MGKLLITQFGSLLFLFMYVKLFATDCLVCNTLLGDRKKCLRPPLGY